MPVYFPRYRFVRSYPDEVDYRLAKVFGHSDRPSRTNPNRTPVGDVDPWWPDDDGLTPAVPADECQRHASREKRYRNFLGLWASWSH